MGKTPIHKVLIKSLNCHHSKACCLVLALLICMPCPAVIAKGTSEQMLKAAFLIHFLNFTKWPINQINDRVICVLGDAPFDNKLHMLASTTRKNQKLIIKYTSNINDTNGCHILFIARSEKLRLEKILKTLENKPILTVSDIQGFATRNGMIELVTKSGKIRLVINLRAVRSPDIKLSSNLIELAQVVNNPVEIGGN